MKYAIIALVVAVVGLIGLSTQPQETSATDATKWPPLSETCHDVNGDGTVDLFNDILGVVNRYGTAYGGPPNAAGYEYALLYDVDGGGQVDLFGDILSVIGAYDQTCSLIDTQAVQATVATMQYRDCDVAVADGYAPAQSGIWVEDMGIHITKNANMSSTFNLEKPFGLVCSEKPGSPAGRPDKLIGVWYIIPVASTGALYGLGSGPFQADDVMPIGFGATNTDEDNIEPPTLFYSGWHTHTNLCVAPGSFFELGDVSGTNGDDWHHPDDPDDQCINHLGGIVNVPLYGWMLHFYNYLPNPLGRFIKWNTNDALQQYIPDIP